MAQLFLYGFRNPYRYVGQGAARDQVPRDQFRNTKWLSLCSAVKNVENVENVESVDFRWGLFPAAAAAEGRRVTYPKNSHFI